MFLPKLNKILLGAAKCIRITVKKCINIIYYIFLLIYPPGTEYVSLEDFDLTSEDICTVYWN